VSSIIERDLEKEALEKLRISDLEKHGKIV
jgi:hypothetical protein